MRSRSLEECSSFGAYRLYPAARILERNGVPVALGSRSLDILIVLVARAGRVVSHRDLVLHVWRDLVVDSGNLRTHISALRKALGEGAEGARYIANVPGQGYSFVVPIRRSRDPEPACGSRCSDAQKHLLPPALVRMTGRALAVSAIATRLRSHRFLTIVGAGGIGKTTVAVSAAHELAGKLTERVCFVDFGTVTDPTLVVVAVASALGFAVEAWEATSVVMEHLRNSSMLLVLDNCEHVIDQASALAERIFGEAVSVRILATSREPLRVEGEHTYWLAPLESPNPECLISAAEALTFPAVKLFVERANADGGQFELRDADVPRVAEVCRKLDGVPLAIELAAGRVGAYGLGGIECLLMRRFAMHWQGRRTAQPRQQTLHSLIEWSYNLLSEVERVVLRRLSVLDGAFSLDLSRAVACDGDVSDGQLLCTVDRLVTKSLMSAVLAEDDAIHYRLFETARIFALEKLEASGEAEAVSLRHSQWISQLALIHPRSARPDKISARARLTMVSTNTHVRSDPLSP